MDRAGDDKRAAHGRSDSDNYVVVGTYVDVSDMSREDIECAISGFYKSIEEMEMSYEADISELGQLVAECMFENIPDESGYNYTSSIVSWDDAEKIIQDVIDHDGKWEERR